MEIISSKLSVSNSAVSVFPVEKQGAEVKPANESKTQHAVNTEGKTNESTKNVKEPLKQGQQKPTEGQQKKQDENKQRQAAPARKPSAPKAKKGVRI